MVYVLGQVEWNNGLPTPKFIGEYNTIDKAMKAFDEYVKGIKIFWESENIIFNHPFHFSANSNSNVGDAIDIQIYAENFLVGAITTAVDRSDETCTYHYIGIDEKESFKIKIKNLEFDAPIRTYIDVDGSGSQWLTFLRIDKRPEFGSTYNDDVALGREIDWVYDLHLKDDDNTEMAFSIDVITYEALFLAYTQIYDK